MVLDVNTLYEFCKFIAKKEQRGFFTPSQFNIAMNVAINDKYSEMIGLISEYQYGSSKPKSGIAMTRKLKLMSTPFKGSAILAGSDSFTDSVLSGKGAYILRVERKDPDSGVFYSAEEVDDAQWMNRVHSCVVPPTDRYPIYQINGNGSGGTALGVLPVASTQIRVAYLRPPAVAKWAFTGSSREIYAEGPSLNPEFDGVYLNDLASRIMMFLGVSLRDSVVTQYAASAKMAND